MQTLSTIETRVIGTAFEILYQPKRYPEPPRNPTIEEIKAQRNRGHARARYYRMKQKSNAEVKGDKT